MRKLFLFFSVVGLSVLMNSCLGDGKNSFTEAYPCYITTDNSTYLTYARTLNGRFITSNEIKLMEPGTFHSISYSWDESYGTTPISIGGYSYPVYNVTSTSEEIGKKELYYSEAPDEENPVPLYYSSQFQAVPDEYGTYWNDHWVIAYAYKIKKGESISAQFYVPPRSSDENNAEVVIDVRLTKSGTAESTAEIVEDDVVALNMAPIRSQYISSANQTVNVKFRFYTEGQTGLYTTTNSYPMRYVEYANQ
ncbi:MAG: hypothetical protein LBS52_02745 [Dysgonamonadaceae bacterium]|jgi:hypothetical protein|nr:hypothetical protein [Dysgonamonadaceae bacterium]